MGGDHGLEFLVRDGFRQYLDIVAVEGPRGRRLRLVLGGTVHLDAVGRRLRRIAGPGGVLRGIRLGGRPRRVVGVLRRAIDVVWHLGGFAVERFRAGLGQGAARRRLGDVVFGGLVDAVGFRRGGFWFDLE